MSVSNFILMSYNTLISEMTQMVVDNTEYKHRLVNYKLFLFKDAAGNTGRDACYQRPFSWCQKFGIIEFSSKIHLHRLSSSSSVLMKDSLVETRYQTTIGILLIFCEYELICILKLQFSGPEITTGTVAFATEIFPSATKISGELANFRFVLTFALSKQKGYLSPLFCYFS